MLCSIEGAVDDWSFCSKHNVLELMSALGSVQQRGAIDDWLPRSKRTLWELMSAIGSVEPVGRHRRPALLQ